MHRIEELKAEMQRAVSRNKFLEAQIIAHSKAVAEHEAEKKRLDYMIRSSHLAVWKHGRLTTLNHAENPRAIIDAELEGIRTA